MRLSRQFTFSRKSERAPPWAPQGDRIAFPSERAGPTQVYVNAPVPEAESQNGSGSPHLADGAQDLERLGVVDVAARQVRQVTRGARRIEDFDWAHPKRLIATTSDHPRLETGNNALYEIPLGADAIRLFARPQQPFAKLLLSPARTQLAFVSPGAAGPIPHDLFLQSIAGGPDQDLTQAVDRSPRRPDHGSRSGGRAACPRSSGRSIVKLLPVKRPQSKFHLVLEISNHKLRHGKPHVHTLIS